MNIVDVTDRRELEADQRPEIRQVSAAEVDVMKFDGCQQNGNCRCDRGNPTSYTQRSVPTWSGFRFVMTNVESCSGPSRPDFARACGTSVMLNSSESGMGLFHNRPRRQPKPPQARL